MWKTLLRYQTTSKMMHTTMDSTDLTAFARIVMRLHKKGRAHANAKNEIHTSLNIDRLIYLSIWSGSIDENKTKVQLTQMPFHSIAPTLCPKLTKAHKCAVSK